jgi:bifunctional DNA-binding transcriptional regulator/antitoxin component of YhaV-PrlF toxin-antitoxin module
MVMPTTPLPTNCLSTLLSRRASQIEMAADFLASALEHLDAAAADELSDAALLAEKLRKVLGARTERKVIAFVGGVLVPQELRRVETSEVFDAIEALSDANKDDVDDKARGAVRGRGDVLLESEVA